MRAYLLLTGSIFGLIGLAHLARLLLEGGHSFAKDPWFVWGNVAAVLAGGGLGVWAAWLLRGEKPSGNPKDRP